MAPRARDRAKGPAACLDADLQRLSVAVGGLIARSPEFSAASGLKGWQRSALALLACTLAGGALLAPEPTLLILLGVMAIPFFMVAALRTLALCDLLRRRPVSVPHAPLSEEELPTYSVLVPLFREAGVVPHLLHALRRIDYPRDKLDVLLIVESVDRETQAALASTRLDPHMRILVVPDGDPRTKPRALQYALQFTQGRCVVVYDAEDAPEPDQLRRAAAMLAAGPARFGCVQAQLNIYNSDMSWLTRGIMAQTPQEIEADRFLHSRA